MPCITFDKAPWSSIHERICAGTEKNTYLDLTDPNNQVSIIIISGQAKVDYPRSLFFSKNDCSVKDKVGPAKICIRFQLAQANVNIDFSFNGDGPGPSIVNFYREYNKTELVKTQTFPNNVDNRGKRLNASHDEANGIKEITITTDSTENNIYRICYSWFIPWWRRWWWLLVPGFCLLCLLVYISVYTPFRPD